MYNSNPAAIAPNQNDVLRGMMREDLFTVVHEQFFTDTADYADVLLPAPTFLEVKDVQGAYGHLFAQVNERAIAPLGEAKSNVALFGELARRMGFTEACFDDREDALIDQALADGPSHGLQGLRASGWSARDMSRCSCRRMRRATFCRSVRRSGSETPSGRGELLPVPVFTAPAESRANAGGGAVSAGVSAAEGGQLYELDVCKYSCRISGWRRGRRVCWRCIRRTLLRGRL